MKSEAAPVASPATPVVTDTARIAADGYTPVKDGIPTGEILPVADTPYDFRTMHPIADHIPQRGYDNNFVFNAHKSGEPVAEVADPKSGRFVRVFTDQVGMQLYVPLFPAPPPSSTGAPPSANGAPRPAPLAAFCLETQHFPDSPNQPKFPSTVLRPGKRFSSNTVYVFGVNRQ